MHLPRWGKLQLARSFSSVGGVCKLLQRNWGQGCARSLSSAGRGELAPPEPLFPTTVKHASEGVRADMLKVGLTGGMASGKSLIVQELARLGCHVIEADALGHEVLLASGEAYSPVVAEFGPSILDAVGAIDRNKLSAFAFHNPNRLKTLTSVVHPAVRRLSDARRAAFERSDPSGILVYEAAILVETGGFRDFDKLIVASAPEEIQIERAMARDGSTREAVVARLRRQLPLSDKVRHADFVIDTGGTMEHTIEQTRSVYEKLRGVKQAS